MFIDRSDAGRKLADRLDKHKGDQNTIILAIPRGGVLVAKEVAKALELPLDVIVVRKLPMPDNPEAGIGAISEMGKIVWQPQKVLYEEKTIKKIIKEQKKEIQRRIEALRGGRKIASLKGKNVVIIDDGIAMGSTMEAAIKTAKSCGARKIIVAVPIGGEEIINRIGRLVDEVICLEVPEPFYAVAQGYENWYDVPDEEVIRALRINRD